MQCPNGDLHNLIIPGINLHYLHGMGFRFDLLELMAEPAVCRL